MGHGCKGVGHLCSDEGMLDKAVTEHANIGLDVDGRDAGVESVLDDGEAGQIDVNQDGRGA